MCNKQIIENISNILRRIICRVSRMRACSGWKTFLLRVQRGWASVRVCVCNKQNEQNLAQFDTAFACYANMVVYSHPLQCLVSGLWPQCVYNFRQTTNECVHVCTLKLKSVKAFTEWIRRWETERVNERENERNTHGDRAGRKGER